MQADAANFQHASPSHCTVLCAVSGRLIDWKASWCMEGEVWGGSEWHAKVGRIDKCLAPG